MTSATIVLLLLVVVVIPFISSEEYKVPENIDVDEILKNERLTKNYVDCMLGKGKCTPEGEELKKSIPEALENDCSKCNDKHREGIRKVLHHLIEKKPEWWQELENKFDPNGAYKQKYNHYLKEEGLA